MGILLFMRLFQIRTPALRSLFLFIPLVRPLIILIEGASQIERLNIQKGVTLGLRIPDPMNLISQDFIGSQERVYTVSAVVSQLVLIALLVSLIFLLIRWISFVIFRQKLKKIVGITYGGEHVRVTRFISELCLEMEINNPPHLLLLRQSNWATPCTLGWRHPTIIFTDELVTSLDDDELRAILAHELGHILRRDGLWRWFSILLRDIQCFNPFSYICMDKLELEREKACDCIAVNRAKVPPRILATCLVKQAQIYLNSNAQPFPAHGVSLLKPKRSNLEDRVSFLLDMPSTDHAKDVRETSFRSPKLFLALALWVPLATLQIYACTFIGGYALVFM